jgi:hypothetical protein
MQHNKRHGHSSCLINDKIYIYGGLITDNNDPTDETDSNQCLVYNTITKEWNQLTAPFIGSHFHSAVSYQNRYMIVFGGKHQSHGFFNTTSIFDTETEKWNIVKYNNCNKVEIPQARYCHKCVIVGDDMFMFGGFDNNGFDCNDLFALHLIEHRWRKIQLKGDIPSERHHFSVNRFNDKSNELVLFGGCNSKIRCMNDLYSINVETGECIKLDTSSIAVSGRYGHVSYMDELSRLHVIGGSSIDGKDLYTETIFTIQQNIVSNIAENDFNGFYNLIYPRYCALSVVNDGSLMLYGGFNANAEVIPIVSMTDVPDDVCNIVLSYLDRFSLCQMSHVSKTLRLSVLSNDDTLWEPIYSELISYPYYAYYRDTITTKDQLSYKQLVTMLSMKVTQRYIGREQLAETFSSISKSKIKSLIPHSLKIVVVGDGAVGKVMNLLSVVTIY